MAATDTGLVDSGLEAFTLLDTCALTGCLLLRRALALRGSGPRR